MRFIEPILFAICGIVLIIAGLYLVEDLLSIVALIATGIVAITIGIWDFFDRIKI